MNVGRMKFLTVYALPEGRLPRVDFSQSVHLSQTRYLKQKTDHCQVGFTIGSPPPKCPSKDGGSQPPV